jgi:uncharacterized protein (UPF0303 family)
MKIALCAFLAMAMALPSSGSKADSVSDKDRLATTIAEEQALVFDSFDNETALRLGTAMVKYAQETKAPQTVFDIRRNGQILFRVSLSVSSTDNEHWVEEKIATMERFHVSTERKKLEFRANMGADWLKAFPNGGGDPVRFWNLSQREAAGLVGGGFPIFVKGAGYVGTIVASGGPDETDHDLVVAVLKSFLGK